jgi:hypothetical protein
MSAHQNKLLPISTHITINNLHLQKKIYVFAVITMFINFHTLKTRLYKADDFLEYYDSYFHN